MGVTDAAAALYRGVGVPVEKLWSAPLAATSLADFWGRRWNRGFSGFARDHLYYPLARVLGARASSLAVFLFSGLLHDWGFSLTVEGGYGGPTLYFLIQGLFTQAESTDTGRRLLRHWPLLGRVWTCLVVLCPLPLLFHPPFVAGVVRPLLASLGVEGL